MHRDSHHRVSIERMPLAKLPFRLTVTAGPRNLLKKSALVASMCCALSSCYSRRSVWEIDDPTCKVFGALAGMRD